MDKAMFKQAVISVVVGALVSILTIAFQALIGNLNELIAPTTGGIGAMATKFALWKTSLLG